MYHRLSIDRLDGWGLRRVFHPRRCLVAVSCYAWCYEGGLVQAVR